MVNPSVHFSLWYLHESQLEGEISISECFRMGANYGKKLTGILRLRNPLAQGIRDPGTLLATVGPGTLRFRHDLAEEAYLSYPGMCRIIEALS
jgi:hypothetical protein